MRNDHLFRLRHKNVSSVAFVLRLFAGRQQIQPQRRIKILDARFLPGLFPGRVVGCVARGAAACALEAGVDDPVNMGMNSYATAEQPPRTTSTAAHSRLLLVFESQLHYDPAFKYVSSFMSSLTGPCGWPPRVTLSMMKNISSRSSALMNRASEV